MVSRPYPPPSIQGYIRDASSKLFLRPFAMILHSPIASQADFGVVLPRISLLATIGFAYSIISPIINGLAVLTFFLFYLAWKFCTFFLFMPNVQKLTLTLSSVYAGFRPTRRNGNWWPLCTQVLLLIQRSSALLTSCFVAQFPLAISNLCK
jgi:hypothetical protein